MIYLSKLGNETIVLNRFDEFVLLTDRWYRRVEIRFFKNVIFVLEFFNYLILVVAWSKLNCDFTKSYKKKFSRRLWIRAGTSWKVMSRRTNECYYTLEKKIRFAWEWIYVDNFSLGKINEAPFFSKSPYILGYTYSPLLLIREAGLQIIVSVSRTLLSTNMKQWNGK